MFKKKSICDGSISVLSVISCVPPVASVTLRDAERCVTFIRHL